MLRLQIDLHSAARQNAAFLSGTKELKLCFHVHYESSQTCLDHIWATHISVCPDLAKS